MEPLEHIWRSTLHMPAFGCAVLFSRAAPVAATLLLLLLPHVALRGSLLSKFKMC